MFLPPNQLPQKQDHLPPPQVKETLELLVSLIVWSEHLIEHYCLDKNSKDAFLKKLQICMKTYDYKDETKDVRGKVCCINTQLNAHYFFSFFLWFK